MSERSIFIAALEKDDSAERAAYLDQVCAKDQPLRQRIERLLKAHEPGDSFLEHRPPGLGATVDAPPIAERLGTVIGPYKLLQRIGEGGMGVVYMAEQDQPVRRKVALKIIKPGMDSKQVIARFEAERQALAMMDHQNIAKVFDAGTTDSGRPYFVMELVHGVPLTTYCDENKLTPRQRLELFVPVCQAIQHAHQKGVIHRDIKPSNILVTMYDDRPVPKVIDFGVAKAVEQRLTEKTLFTQYGTLVGTFEYMSPEQSEMNAFGVDTRSDIYSLGVLLYELLTGTTPLERGRLREAALSEMLRLIKEEEPQRPSVRLSTSGALAKVAAARKTDPAKLSRLMRGELDWVVMRCLEKDRSRRYDTASGLAKDVERYLKDEPVEARPQSVTYRLRKLFRRNKAAVLTTAAIAAALLLGTAISTWLAIRATRAEAEARSAEDQAKFDRDLAQAAETKAKTQKETAQAALNFLWQDMRSNNIPLLDSDRDLKLRTLLDRVTARLDKGSGKPPLVEASIRQMVGQLYLDIGGGDVARKHLQWALDVQRRELGEEDHQTLATMHSLGECLFRTGGPLSAEAREASRVLDRTLELRRRVLGDDDRDTVTTMRWAALTRGIAENEKRRQLFAEAVETGMRNYPNDRETLWAMADYASFLNWQGQLDQAKDLLTQCLDRTKSFDVQDPFPVLVRHRLFFTYFFQNDLEQAEMYGSEALRGIRILGNRYAFSAELVANLARVYQMRGRLDQVTPLVDELLAGGESSYALELRGRVLLAEKKYAEAEQPLRESMRLNASNPMRALDYHLAHHELGASLLGQKKYADAAAVLAENHVIVKKMSERLGRDLTPGLRRLQVETLEWLVQLYEEWNGHAHDAAKWRKELSAAKEGAKKP